MSGYTLNKRVEALKEKVGEEVSIQIVETVIRAGGGTADIIELLSDITTAVLSALVLHRGMTGEQVNKFFDDVRSSIAGIVVIDLAHKLRDPRP